MATINTIKEANSRLEDHIVDTPPLRMDFRDSLNRLNNVGDSYKVAYPFDQSLDRWRVSSGKNRVANFESPRD